MNAKDEFLKEIRERPKLKCAQIIHESSYPYYDEDNVEYEPSKYNLRVNHSDEEFLLYCEILDFHYDNGYGSQEVFGMIWYEDGSWSERHEYDGAEGWIYKTTPKIPEELL